MIWGLNPSRAKNFSLLQNIFTSSMAKLGTWGNIPFNKSSQGVRMTTHLHLVLRLRMGAAIPSFSVHVCMVCPYVKHTCHQKLCLWSHLEIEKTEWMLDFAPQHSQSYLILCACVYLWQSGDLLPLLGSWEHTTSKHETVKQAINPSFKH